MGSPRKLRPLSVLLAGFGGLLVFVVAAAAGSLVMLERVRAEDRRIRQSFIDRLGALERIRAQIYLSGSWVRDYLLSPEAAPVEVQRDKLGGIEAEMRTLLDQYQKAIGAGEMEPFKALREEIDAYWLVLQSTFEWPQKEREKRRSTFFYEQLVPRRTTMLQIADGIAAINQRGLVRAEERFDQSAESLRWSLVGTFGVAIVGSLLLAGGTILLTWRLEREVARRGQDMQELSGRLEKAQEEERRQLARELHDEVGQSLSAIVMEAEAVETALESGDAEGEVRARARSISSVAGATLNAVRDLALLLRPSMLDDFGLVPALNWHAREMAKRTGLKIRISAAEDLDDLPDEHKTCIYRMVQEASNNAARHAGARQAQVAVRRVGGRVVFSVQDDGSGFDKRTVRGLGLLGMEERVRRLGGNLRIDSSPGRGTLISAELPAPGHEEGHAVDSNPAG